ncbi:MAG: VWA domain-containing protein [bacterium]|nr:VWA domain-containing protein [bacterium]
MFFYYESVIYISFIILIVLVLLFYYGLILKKRLIRSFGDINIIRKFSSLDFKIYRKKAILLLVVIFLVFFSLARPQWGNRTVKSNRKGLDILILLDVSRSMLAGDMLPNRLTKAKHEIERLVDYLQGDRIGLITFSGRSFLQCPLTIDYSAFVMYLDNTDINSVPVPGTAIADALERSINSFPQVEKKYKVVILLTDGEDHEGNVVEAAQKARDEGVVIFTIGIGSVNGELIPIHDSNGNTVGYKKDKAGNPVLSRLDEVTLEKIAVLTGGKYYKATESEFELKKVYDDIQSMEKKTIFGRLLTQREDRYQWFLLPALLLLFLEIFLKEKNKNGKKRTD